MIEAEREWPDEGELLEVIRQIVARGDLEAGQKTALIRFAVGAPQDLTERVAVVAILDPDGLQAWREDLAE
jgi:hypothetical protein